ncbi:MAG TPA: HAMP domain-containing sensor histidine kinase [Candidatus Limnocylindrales bacterium]|nr:HAMP domain-containing sensor histidine kinase [Candidatus Limnocylindrales bacterium]
MAERGTLPEVDPAEARALAADASLIRGVRWRLVALSAGLTLVALLLLGVALYAIAARSLAESGRQQLEARAADVKSAIVGFRREPRLGQIFGGRASGTFAMLVFEDGTPVLRNAPEPPGDLPLAAGLEAAALTRQDVRTAVVRTASELGDKGTEELPVRVLTERLDSIRGPVYLQVIQDRTAEQRTLAAMLAVLLVGGGAVVLVAIAFGALYASRALVPIRESLAAQRAALRRQRQFAADASHELRTPLTVIRSSVEHLRRQGASAGDATEAIDDIEAEVAHLTSLVDDLLLLARSDSGAITLARQPVDVGDIAADAAGALAKPAAERDVQIVVDPEPAMVDGDPARLRQLVLILVDNALRHSPRGGEVRVSVRTDRLSAVLEVQDDGPGIREEDLPRVFERFFRAPGAPSGGTGLGLAIAASIVDLHGGRIAVANRPPKGACFRVTLPVDPARPRPASTPSTLGVATDRAS